MKVIINRTKEKLILPNDKEIFADVVAHNHGFMRLQTSDIDNINDIQWEGIEFNRLFWKGNKVYRFNNWLGSYPYNAIVLEEIGIAKWR